jgi:hypothetical protein
LIYPDLGISKIQLARYFNDIADWIVPHVCARPLTLVHCPAGLAEPCLYLKHAKAWGPSALRRAKIQEKIKVGEYLVADSIEAVVCSRRWASVKSTRGIPRPTTSSARIASCGISIPGIAIAGEDHWRPRPARRRAAHTGARRFTGNYWTTKQAISDASFTAIEIVDAP